MKLQIVGIGQEEFDKGLHLKKRFTVGREEIVPLYVPNIYIPLMYDERPVQILYGSRFAAKSYSKAYQLLYKASTSRYFRGIFTRNTKTAARKSQFQLFQDLFERTPELEGLFSIRESDMKITCRRNKNFMMGASFEDPDSLMAVPDATDTWLEEPITRSGAIERQAFTTLQGNMRNPYGKVQSHLTFNPISKANFIYEDYFDPEKKKFGEDRVGIHKINWRDNPFCPEDRVQYLADMKSTDYDRWLIDSEGEFGVVKTGKEYYSKMESSSTIRSSLPIDPNGSIHVGIDYNTNPYMSAKVYQVKHILERGEMFELRCLREYALSAPLNTVEDTAEAILNDFEHLIAKNGMFLYADATGKAKIPIKRVRSLQDQLIKGFKGHVGSHNMRIPKANPRHRDNPSGSLGRHSIMNKVLNPADREWPFRFLIDASCNYSITDLQSIQIGPDGKKVKPTKRENGVTFEKLGHMSDIDDYVICFLIKKFFI